MSSQRSSKHGNMSWDLVQHYEDKVRPHIDLVDSLRELGIEKDLNLPAIAVIGDQSSGKSSVLEALSGVALPRGTGIVTRCPLVLKLKKVKNEDTWLGVLSFKDQHMELESPAEVENAVLDAQMKLAGQEGISHEVITLEIQSNNVPDLTLIDLPGIARVATGNQPKDIEKQIKDLIEKFIQKQETISLVVVPANIDIATTGAIQMASNVDPGGFRTLGVLTKPDLVDKGMEEAVVKIVKNLEIPLEKGYMIVKCRGQQDINDKLNLAEALEKERMFFKASAHFRPLLKDGKATIPRLAEKLTNELVLHITNSLPQLQEELKMKLAKTTQDLKLLGDGVPLDEHEKNNFLIKKIHQYNDALEKLNRAEDDHKVSGKKVYTQIKKECDTWKMLLDKKTAKMSPVNLHLRTEVVDNIRVHRGKELPGVVDKTTFESLICEHIDELEDPALTFLKDVRDIVLSSVNTIVVQHFERFPRLLREAEYPIEDFLEEEFQKAEEKVQSQFRMEKIIYCQDSLYIRQQGVVQQQKVVPEISDVQNIAWNLNAYLTITSDRLANQVPLIVLYHVDKYISRLQNEMYAINRRFDADDLLKEDDEVARKRKELKERSERLKNAGKRLTKFVRSEV
ncbi:interferon-induced GTP-binding protein Mx-like isoform X6 [Triplophysa dalaica]|uniref:interferon-induced GTP-binding protein Mx-like isoform X6 n=1 Tax=Triplophysa dalaica TaxID=1582913 RepID=UPI0024DF85C9|nr:interferon-induced GTP-binding protein Mx-like isoform X6 [Triplophysa dalaica]